MKKNIISTTLAIALCVFGLTAQTTEFDAMRLAQTDISGTARFMGMAGAFGALGGDVSAIHANPAGLGVYRSSELTMTLNLANQFSNANWDGVTANDNLTRLGLNNVGLVWANRTMNARTGNTTGLLQSNWAFSHNRLRDFNRNVTVRGNEMSSTNSITQFYANFTDANFIENRRITQYDFGYTDDFDYLPWMSILAFQTFLINDDGTIWSSALGANETITPSFFMEERGSLDEFSFSWGGNFSNTFFVGANVNFQSIVYTMRSRYIEDFGNENLNLRNDLRTTGAGVSFGLGVIYRPVHFLRFGLSYQTPKWYELTHTNRAIMTTNLRILNDEIRDPVNGIMQMQRMDTYEGIYDRSFRTPGIFRASVAGVIGQRAIISTDVVYTDFRNIRIIEPNRRMEDPIYDQENRMIRNTFSNSFTVKVGAEYRVTNQFSVRAGFAAQTPTMHTTAVKQHKLNTTRTDTEYFVHRGTHLFTAGLGYRGNFWYFDAAFVNRNVREDFMPFESEVISPARVTTRNFDVVATVGLRF